MHRRDGSTCNRVIVHFMLKILIIVMRLWLKKELMTDSLEKTVFHVVAVSISDLIDNGDINN